MSATAASPPVAGFGDPIHEPQQAFRALLDAMAHPGRRISVSGDIAHPPGLAASVAAALLTLCDFETPVLIDPGCNAPAAQDWLRFHAGAPAAGEYQRAAIAVLDAAQVPSLEGFALGSDEAPEKGATLLVQVPSLDGAAGLRWSGPGIKREIMVPLFGLPASFWRQRLLLGSAFPRGLDIYFCHEREVVGLPRSTAIAFPEV